MSRRKQARPRLCKRDEEDGEEESDGKDDLENGTDAKKMRFSDDKQANIESERSPETETETHSGVEPEVFKCETCDATFYNLVHFMDHRNNQCESNLNRIKTENGTSSRADTPLSVDSQVSNQSSRASSVDGLDPNQIPCHVGITEDHPVPCQFCDKAFAKTSHLRLHEQVHADVMPYNCTLCQRVFRSKKSLDRHVKTHVTEKKYECTQCDLSFTSQEQLKSHVKIHIANESYPCPVCGLKYPTMAALMSHQNAHKPKPPSLNRYDAKCMDCNSVFRTEKDLAEHDCSDIVGKRTFQCQHCSAICVGATAFALHTEHAHSMMNGDQTKCPICYKMLETIEDLTNHIKMHESALTDLSNEIATGNQSDLNSLEFGAKMLGASNGMIPMDVLMCPYCLRDDFETLEHLELHMQSVHSVKPTEVYTCNYCNAPYKNLYSLHEHMRAIHQNQPSMGIKYPCSKCGKEFPSIESLQDHKKRMHHKHKQAHNETVYQCEYCSLSFMSLESRRDHLLSAHRDRIREKEEAHHKLMQVKARVKLCNNSSNKTKDDATTEGHTIINVPEPSHILRHLRTPVKSPFHSPSGTVHHNASPTGSQVSPRPLSASPSGGRSESSKEKITCDQCNASFTDLLTYQSHVKLHLDTMLGQYSCRECGKMFISEEHLETHISSHFLKVLPEYCCTTCNKSFNKADELQKHLMDIHAHHLYKCSLCKEVFDSKVNIQVHFAIKHSNENKLYHCVSCDRVFLTENEWQVHLRSTHLQISKPYRCLFCKESFATEMDLQCHLATHNKPFKCSMCEESFLVEFLLDKHIQNVHSEGEQDGSSLRPDSDGMDAGLNGIHLKIKKESDLVKQEMSAASGSNLFGSLLSGSAHDTKITFSTPGSLMPEVGGGVFSNLAGSGSMVWRSPDDLYRCNICDMKFSQMSGLQTHKMQDHGVKYLSPTSAYSPTSSPKDCVTNGSQESLNTMLNNQHSSETGPVNRKSTTSVLQEALTSSMSLPLNIQETSPTSVAFTEKLVSTFGEKVCLACTFCSQTFKCKGDLEKHSKIHLNTGSQKCNICDEVFASSGILAEHKLSHCKIQQGNTCVACKIPIKNEEQFYLHSQEHGFQGAIMQCIVCRQTLASMLELQMHGRHHFQSKTVFHTCCVCLKSFNSSENLISKLNSSGRTYYVCKPCYHGETNEHSCKQCSLKFDSPTALQAHSLTHRKSYQCIKCQQSFDSEQEIQLHVATHMMKEGNIHECNLCFLILDSPAKLQCHLIEHTYKNSEYRCSVCGHAFLTASDIQTHALDHGIASRKYCCNQCNQRFFFSAELENHLYVHRKQDDNLLYGKKDNSLVIQPLSHQSLKDIEDQSKTIESLVNKQQNIYSFKADASDFMSTEENNTSPKNKVVSSTSGLQDEILKVPDTDTEKGIQCTSCPQVFGDSGSLQSHFFTMHAGKPNEGTRTKAVCMECGKECSSESNLLNHLNTHIKGNRVGCPSCDRTFTSSAALTLHTKSNCGQKRYECPICHKLFTKKAKKMEHMKSHSGGKVYTCSECGKLFPNKLSLKKHLETHQSSTTADSNEEEARLQGSASEFISISAEQSSEEELSDPEKDEKQEVTSTSNIPEEASGAE